MYRLFALLTRPPSDDFYNIAARRFLTRTSLIAQRSERKSWIASGLSKTGSERNSRCVILSLIIKYSTNRSTSLYLVRSHSHLIHGHRNQTSPILGLLVTISMPRPTTHRSGNSRPSNLPTRPWKAIIQVPIWRRSSQGQLRGMRSGIRWVLFALYVVRSLIE